MEENIIKSAYDQAMNRFSVKKEKQNIYANTDTLLAPTSSGTYHNRSDSFDRSNSSTDREPDCTIKPRADLWGKKKGEFAKGSENFNYSDPTVQSTPAINPSYKIQNSPLADDIELSKQEMKKGDSFDHKIKKLREGLLDIEKKRSQNKDSKIFLVDSKDNQRYYWDGREWKPDTVKSDVDSGKVRHKVTKIDRKFIKEDPQLWLRILESAFENYDITDEESKLQIAISNMPGDILAKVKSYLVDSPEPWSLLREGIISTFSEASIGEKVNFLLNSTQDKKSPKEYMGDLLNKLNIPINDPPETMKSIIRQVFISNMPSYIKTVISSLSESSSLESLASAAERIYLANNKEGKSKETDEKSSFLANYCSDTLLKTMKQLVNSVDLIQTSQQRDNRALAKLRADVDKGKYTAGDSAPISDEEQIYFSDAQSPNFVNGQRPPNPVSNNRNDVRNQFNGFPLNNQGFSQGTGFGGYANWPRSNWDQYYQNWYGPRRPFSMNRFGRGARFRPNNNTRFGHQQRYFDGFHKEGRSSLDQRNDVRVNKHSSQQNQDRKICWKHAKWGKDCFPQSCDDNNELCSFYGKNPNPAFL